MGLGRGRGNLWSFLIPIAGQLLITAGPGIAMVLVGAIAVGFVVSLFLVRMVIVRGVGRSLLATDLALALPMALIQGSGKILKSQQAGRLTDAGDLVLESVGKSLVVVSGESLLIPSGTAGVSVELESVPGSLGRVLVP